MPIVRIQLAKGRTDDEKTELMRAVTEAIHNSIDVPLPSIHIMIQEIPVRDIMVGGETLSLSLEKDRV